MRKLVCVVAVIVTASLGAYLAAGHGRPGGVWGCSHLDVVQEQLASVKRHLELYKATHGRYPTHDEGVAVLDNFEAKFVVEFHGLTTKAVQEHPEFRGPIFGVLQWQTSRAIIARYRQEHGRVPGNAKELRSTGLLPDVASPGTGSVIAVPIEIAIGTDDCLFPIGPSGVLSPWLVPYAYENRHGVDPGKFKDSPADSDSGRRYSVRVDDGIYVYSVNEHIRTAATSGL